MEILTFEMFVINARVRRKIIRKDIKKKALNSHGIEISNWMLFSVIHPYSIMYIYPSHMECGTFNTVSFHCSFHSQKQLNFQQSGATLTHRESIDFANEIWFEFVIIEKRKRDRTTTKNNDNTKHNESIFFTFEYWRIEFQIPMKVSQMQIISYFPSYLTYTCNRYYGNADRFLNILHVHITIQEN